MVPSADPTLQSLLVRQAGRFRDKLACAMLSSDGTPQATRTFGDLLRRAESIADGLRARCRPGDRVLLLFPQGVEFVDGFFGSLGAGTIAVPAHLPISVADRRHADKVYRIVEDCQPSLVLSCHSVLPAVEKLLAADALTARLPLLCTEDVASVPSPPPFLRGESTDIATLIYTSGSTGNPKGVIVRQSNVIRNLELVTAKFENDPDASYVSWLPLYHDLGLVVVMLGAIHCGASSYLMHAEDFVSKPVRWLNAISRFGARNAGGPNFGFELCVRKTTAAERQSLDLSSWQVAFNGAEPVRAETLERFVRMFEPHGFRADAHYPCYGMAEATGIVTGGRVRTLPRVLHVDLAALRDGTAVIVPNQRAGTALVGCGTPGDAETVLIVDPASAQVCPDRQIGEVWVAGDSIGTGYFGRPEATQEAFGARISERSGPTFLRTGDLGFLHQGELYLTGRLKDVIIVHGANHYPQDIEHTAEHAHPAVRPGGCAAFSIDDGNEERLGLVAEIRSEAEAEDCADEILHALRVALTERHAIPVGVIALLPPRVLLKTTSGKTRRRAIRDSLLCGRLPTLATFRTPSLAAPTAPLPDLELRIGKRGRFDGLCVTESRLQSAPLGEQDVLVRMHAVGLNFRDVLTILGEYPQSTDTLGYEGAGVVERIGTGVAEIRPGDRVMGLFRQAASTVAVTDHRRLVRIPERLGFAEAAALPVCYLTARLSLRPLFQMPTGSRVLIHAATGGVGLAAIQIAQQAGAEIFATSSPHKWPALHARGIAASHVASSRDLAFEQTVRAGTNGEGVDIVLNSLTHEFIDGSLRVTAKGGHFVELGKRDIRSPSRIAGIHPTVTYSVFDLDDIEPAEIHETLQCLVSELGSGTFTPLPITSYSARDIEAALVTMARAAHVGKLVLTNIESLSAVRMTPIDAAPRNAVATALSGELQRTPAHRRVQLLSDLLAQQISALFPQSASPRLSPTSPLHELGLDSLRAVELRSRMEEVTGIELPVALLFDYPTPQRLVQYLLGRLGVDSEEDSATPEIGLAPVPSSGEAIAIIAMACRFPGGVSTPDELWELLVSERDAITEIPAARFPIDPYFSTDPSAEGKSYSRWGGFVGDVSKFDANFFGISPREARSIDPQQRLLLETTWEAFEQAGIPSSQFEGSRTGVYIGIAGDEYGRQISQAAESIDAYSFTGTAHSTSVGRLSYTLGLQGPNMAIDTACSSSLVAVHLACQGLLSGDCDLAVTGGVNLLLDATSYIQLSRLRALSPTGRCHAFDDSADGYVRSEGCGVLLLKRLSEAERDGDCILAVIKATAANQDGKSQGLTAPNGPAQESVIRAALQRAQVPPQTVSYVECHGTGTKLGDPIEIAALASVYGQGRTQENPLWVGSIKSNIGHAEAAAGMAGLIKVVLCLQHGRLPRSLHIRTPNKHIPWSTIPVSVVGEIRDWSRAEHPLRAGVSSFGISGTNVHVILESVPDSFSSQPPPMAPQAARVTAAGPPTLLTWSAKSQSALRAQAGRLAKYLNEHPNVSLHDVAFSLLTTRSLFQQRAAVVVSSIESAITSLSAFTRGQTPRDMSWSAQRGPCKLACMFTGQGSQRLGMGRSLSLAFPLFHTVLREVASHLDPHLSHPLLAVLFADPDSELGALLEQTAFTQPALFAFEVALFRLMMSLGLQPDFVTGHSVGEITAAHVAGVLSLQDACKLVAMRGRLMQEGPEGGAMLAVSAGADALLPLCSRYSSQVGIAAYNAPKRTVLSGDKDAIEQVAKQLSAQGIESQLLHVRHAFHSHHLDGMMPAFADVLRTLTWNEAQIPLISNVTGKQADPKQIQSVDYWMAQARQPVKFWQGVDELVQVGVGRFVEFGPRGVLSALVQEALPDSQSALITTLQRTDRDEVSALLCALGSLHCDGVPLQLDSLFAMHDSMRIPLPTYPFERQRHWIDRRTASHFRTPAHGHVTTPHCLLSWYLQAADSGALLFSGQLALSDQPWLADHQVLDQVVVPAAALLDCVLAIAASQGDASISELSLLRPLLLTNGAVLQLQAHVLADETERGRAFSLFARTTSAAPTEPWTEYASGFIGTRPPASDITAQRLSIPESAVAQAIDSIYAQLSTHGLTYGPAFQLLRAVWIAPNSVFAQVRLTPEQCEQCAGFQIHPALLDAALHALIFVLPLASDGEVWLPASWRNVSLLASHAQALIVQLTVLEASDSDALRINLRACNDAGQPVLQVDEICLRPVRHVMRGSSLPLHRMVWQPIQLPPPAMLPLGTIRIGSSTSWLASVAPDCFATVAEYASTLHNGKAVARRILWDATERATPATAQQDATAAHRLVRMLLTDLHAFVRHPSLGKTELCVLTQGAVAALSEDSVFAPAQATLWGLLRSVRSELPDCSLRLIDIAAGCVPALLSRALAASDPEQALRSDHSLAPSLAMVDSPLIARHSSEIPMQGTVLITGGTGELGGILAQHLVDRHGVRHLLLLSRRGAAAEGAADLAASLSAKGVQVSVKTCDVSQHDELAAVLATIDPTHPLCAVFHCAGTLDDAVLDSLTLQRMSAVCAPKIDGAWNLHLLTQTLRLDAFVLFSSAAASLGTAGQAAYAAANAYLDALAAYRKGLGLTAQSLAWGPWKSQGLGMAAQLDSIALRRIEQQGIGTLSIQEGLALLDAAMLLPDSFLIPIRLSEEIAAKSDFPLLRKRRTRAPSQKTSHSKSYHEAPSAAHTAARPTSRSDSLVGLVAQEVAQVLGVSSAAELSLGRPLRELGMDSLMMVELRNRLKAVTQHRIDVSSLWNLGTIAAIAQELEKHISQATAPAVGPREPESAATGNSNKSGGRQTTAIWAPLSSAQQRLFFLDRVLLQRHAYNLLVAFEIDGVLDTDVLRQAIEHLVSRHEQLRSTFHEQDGVLKQRTVPWMEAPLEELPPLVGSSPDARTALRKKLQQEASKPFQLAVAPLFRILYVRLGQNASALAIVSHHITMDGASLGLLFAELDTLYTRIRSEQPLELPPAQSYLSAILRERDWLASSQSEPHRAWWRKTLSGLPALDLPTDRPTPAMRTQRGGVVHFQVEADLAACVVQFASDQQTTPSVLLCAAWTLLLSRYARQDDFAIGIMLAGRNDLDTQRALGLFVNTLPLRCTPRAVLSVQQYVKQIQEGMLGAIDHQELPLDEIVRLVSASRASDLGSSPLFRVGFVIEEFAWQRTTFAGSSTRLLTDSFSGDVEGTAKFDLSLSMMRRADEYVGSIEYNSDLLDRATAMRMTEQLTVILAGLVREPQAQLHSLPLLPGAERTRLLFEWNNTAQTFPADRCIHQLFEAQQERTPHAIAVVYEDQQITYQALNVRANHIAHLLRQKGAGPDALIAICIERSLDMVVGVLGILKAGAAYLPIDPTYPHERILVIMQDAQPQVVLTTRAIEPRLPSQRSDTLIIDEVEPDSTGHRASLLPLPPPSSLAYVIYTSGSTGLPKGVMIEHRSLCNQVTGWTATLGIRPGQRMLQMASLSFDVATLEIFSALTTGVELHLFPSDRLSPGPDMARWLTERRISFVDCTPSVLALLPSDGISGVHSLTVGAETCPAHLAARFAQGRTLRNAYGPTEATIQATSATLLPNATEPPIGKPLPNYQIYILDEARNPVPIGVPGEIHIGGIGVARGYLHRPELTAQKFIPNPFSKESGARIYKTGDLGRYLPDGNIQFLGRMDDQVKIRGVRIELGEIDAALSSHPDVSASFVQIREDHPGDRRICVYVIPRSGSSADVDALRAHLSARLPSSMLPSFIVPLSALPMTPNGKVDRRALPAPIGEPNRGGYVAPRTETEQILGGIFASVLGRSRVGMNEDFFAMGGNSLLSLQVVSRAREAGYSLSARDLFEHPTVGGLAAQLGRDRPSTCVVPLVSGVAPGAILFAPGAAGTLYTVSALAQRLRCKRPIFGLTTPPHVADEPMPTTLRALCERYRSELASAGISGPLTLVGHSFGGHIVLELSCILAESGYQIERLVLLDAGPPAPLLASPSWFDAVAMLRGFAEVMELRLSPQDFVGLSVEQATNMVVSALVAAGIGPIDARSWIRAVLCSAEATAPMLATWAVRGPSAPIHLMYAQDESTLRDADLGWGAHFRLASVDRIPGDHLSMIQRSHVDTTASAISARLTDTEK